MSNEKAAYADDAGIEAELDTLPADDAVAEQ